jgi:predicted nucleotidyltransferase
MGTEMSNSYRDTQSPAHRYALGLTRSLRDLLGAELVGVYLHGSAATGEEVPGVSDADLIAICQHPLSERQRESLRAALATSAPLPASRRLTSVCSPPGPPLGRSAPCPGS